MLQSTFDHRQQRRDDLTLAQNIRSYCHAVKIQVHGLTMAEIARRADIHPTSLSRILAGNGASEHSLVRIANAIGIPPGRFIARVQNIEKYPNIKPIRERTSRRRRYSPRPARSLEDLINDPELAAEFVGGAPNQILPWLLESLTLIHQTCRRYQVRY
jgi:transcriptional regulator with XRE-family HTH domain